MTSDSCLLPVPSSYGDLVITAITVERSEQAGFPQTVDEIIHLGNWARIPNGYGVKRR